jgi:hypothetical protein
MNITNTDELFDYLIDHVKILVHDDDDNETEVVPIAMIVKNEGEIILSLFAKDELFDE